MIFFMKLGLFWTIYILIYIFYLADSYVDVHCHHKQRLIITYLNKASCFCVNKSFSLVSFRLQLPEFRCGP